MSLGASLYVYKGDWGLPTIDFECLRAMCLVQFTRCPVQINTSGNPFRSGVGKLPYLQVGDKKFTGYRKIKQFLDNEGYPIDKNLDAKAKNLSSAYANWVFTNLHGYYHYFLFGEPHNAEETRMIYAKRTPFPLNFYYPVQYQKEAYDVVLVFGGFHLYEKIENHHTEYIVLTAKKCVNALSRKLGQKVWFFGDVFSELDAIVYSYLAIIFKIPIPNNPLKNHIKGCPNLVNFINRISKDIFKSESVSSIKKMRSTAGHENMLSTTERHFQRSGSKIKLCAGIGAMIAMTAFALWRGSHTQFYDDHYYRSFDYDDHMKDDDDDDKDMN